MTITISEARYRAMQRDHGGFCTSCGAEAGPVEPDARNYRCEVCDAPAVFGIEELLLMEELVITEGDDEAVDG